MGVPTGVIQEEGRTGFLHLPSAVLALIFLARRIQPFLSLVDREVEFCALRPCHNVRIEYVHIICLMTDSVDRSCFGS